MTDRRPRFASGFRAAVAVACCAATLAACASAVVLPCPDPVSARRCDNGAPVTHSVFLIGDAGAPACGSTSMPTAGSP